MFVDNRHCRACGACEEICPEVFRMDENLGYAQVLDSEPYPEDKIDRAIASCPGRCIEREEPPAPRQQTADQYFCQKYQEDYITNTTPACRHPKDYCQFRSACPIHFLEKEGHGR